MTNHLLSMTRMYVLSLAVAGFPALSQANDESAPPIANTTGPLSGLSVVRDPGSKEYRVLWPGHRIIRGSLVHPLPVGHEWAVIRPEQGPEEAFAVRPLARNKVSAIPVHVPAIFLMDEANKIIDASFGSEEVLQRRTTEWKKPPPKAPYRQVEGTLLQSPGSIRIKTGEGREQDFHVRPYLQEKFAHIPEGASVILLVDDENTVSDLSKIPSRAARNPEAR